MATDPRPDYQVDEQPMLALRRARRAWERSQPQLTLDWETLDGLSEGVKRAADAPQHQTSPVAAAAPSLSPSNPARGVMPRFGSSAGTAGSPRPTNGEAP